MKTQKTLSRACPTNRWRYNPDAKAMSANQRPEKAVNGKIPATRGSTGSHPKLASLVAGLCHSSVGLSSSGLCNDSETSVLQCSGRETVHLCVNM